MNLISSLKQALVRFESAQAMRETYLWPALLILAAFAYLYSLGGLYIPTSPDEQLYLLMTRMSSESGHWLPLQGPDYWLNAKPPLFFWQAIVATDWGQDWDLFVIRFPTVVYTFLTAGLIFLLSRRLGAERETAYIATATFLAFGSSFLYGRPMMTNMPETFFAFLSFSLVLLYRQRFLQGNLKGWLLIGVLVGLITLYRSVSMLVPVGFTLALLMWQAREWDLKACLKKDLIGLIVMGTIAIAIFLLWPLADPHPETILNKFLVQENLKKVTSHGGGYLAELGPGLVKIWLGHFANAGLLMFALFGLLLYSYRRRQLLSATEKSMWLIVLAYLLVFSIPSQRQENYLMPSIPALAILFALNWKAFSANSLRLFHLPVLLLVVVMALLILSVAASQNAELHYTLWQFAIVALALGLVSLALLRPQSGRYLLHGNIFLTYILIGIFFSPLEYDHGRYTDELVEQLQGEEIYIPHDPHKGYGYDYDKHRFILPGTLPQAFDQNDTGKREQLLAEGRIVATYLPLTAATPAGHIELGRRIVLRPQMADNAISELLLHHRLDGLLMQEVLLQRQ